MNRILAIFVESYKSNKSYNGQKLSNLQDIDSLFKILRN